VNAGEEGTRKSDPLRGRKGAGCVDKPGLPSQGPKGKKKSDVEKRPLKKKKTGHLAGGKRNSMGPVGQSKMKDIRLGQSLSDKVIDGNAHSTREEKEKKATRNRPSGTAHTAFHKWTKSGTRSKGSVKPEKKKGGEGSGGGGTGINEVSSEEGTISGNQKIASPGWPKKVGKGCNKPVHERSDLTFPYLTKIPTRPGNGATSEHER